MVILDLFSPNNLNVFGGVLKDSKIGIPSQFSHIFMIAKIKKSRISTIFLAFISISIKK
jgi:hypothetical protein